MKVRSHGAMALLLCIAGAAGTGCKPKELTFYSVNPTSGKITGNEELRIRGDALDKLGTNVSVRVGGLEAKNVGIEGSETIVLKTPPGDHRLVGKPQSIYILTTAGQSIVLKDVFTYTDVPGAARSGASNDDLRTKN